MSKASPDKGDEKQKCSRAEDLAVALVLGLFPVSRSRSRQGRVTGMQSSGSAKTNS